MTFCLFSYDEGMAPVNHAGSLLNEPAEEDDNCIELLRGPIGYRGWQQANRRSRRELGDRVLPSHNVVRELMGSERGCVFRGKPASFPRVHGLAMAAGLVAAQRRRYAAAFLQKKRPILAPLCFSLAASLLTASCEARGA